MFSHWVSSVTAMIVCYPPGRWPAARVRRPDRPLSLDRFQTEIDMMHCSQHKILFTSSQFVWEIVNFV